MNEEEKVELEKPRPSVLAAIVHATTAAFFAAPIAVAPGRFGIAAFSPPLDAAGNSVRAQRSIEHVVEQLGANPYLVTPR